LGNRCGESSPSGIWGTTITLFVLADGTVSLYTSQGFGVIGAGQHESVWDIGKAILTAADPFVRHAAPKSDQSAPVPGIVRFRFLTFEGPQMVDVPLSQGRAETPFKGYFEMFQELMAEIRHISG
jgi:hypothetical protein